MLYDFGFPMGPFAMSDLAGLDIGWRTARGEGVEFATDRATVLCEIGRRGQKTGAGYYTYDPDDPRRRRPTPRSSS